MSVGPMYYHQLCISKEEKEKRREEKEGGKNKKRDKEGRRKKRDLQFELYVSILQTND